MISLKHILEKEISREEYLQCKFHDPLNFGDIVPNFLTHTTVAKKAKYYSHIIDTF